MFINDVLYKQGHLLPLFRCLDCEKAEYVLREIHKSICGNHYASHILSHKALKQGYN